MLLPCGQYSIRVHSVAGWTWAAASGQLPLVITNIGPNLLTLTGTVSGEVNPTGPQWSSRTNASNGTILYFT